MTRLKTFGIGVLAISLLVGLFAIGLKFVDWQKDDLSKFHLSFSPKSKADDQSTKPSEKSEKQSENPIISSAIKKKLASEVGGIVIPDISLNMSINEGMDENSITYGAGIDMPEPNVLAMGKGNFILASHDYPNTFGKLINVTSGMLIFTTDLDKIYTFKVVEVFTADNDDVRDIKRVREQLEGVDRLTLYTCKGGIGTPFRTVVQADLVSSERLEKVSDETKKLFNQ